MTEERGKQLILVVQRDKLLGTDAFEGFMSSGSVDFESRILKNFEWMRRHFAENDSRYKQPIIYSVILNRGLKKVFLYQRETRDERYGEKRLQGKFTCGIGGHIDKPDIAKGNPIQTSREREIHEEVEILGNYSLNPTPFGYINDDSNNVGQVHFGIVYLVETDATGILPKDPEIAEGKLEQIEVLEELCSCSEIVENWSRIILEPLKEYLNK